ncbi:hypothetical protein PISMIDRAFT_682985 [Pisolithus microcarpus 441]|uniref:Unplaced genomic scaffold scaffold_98, whole genome shotgun sequence n=1 Tax=Pisolithus microcarpus 441 TaxID=765257 RepID=A0A0C9YZY6_9AGAM|nr:hypothetical protein PISMIDRAFT_682985 [Pisolithus microcarpus 441]
MTPPIKFFRAIIRCSKKMIKAGRGKTIDAVREVLDPPDVDMHALLQMRARANRSLDQVLGITSTFASEDERTHEEDIGRVERLLSVVNLETTGWRRLVKVADRSVFHFLPTSSCEFATFIRCVTFHTWVVGVLNPDDPHNRELQHVDLTVEQITNAIFEFSEHGQTNVSPTQIHNILGQWVTGREDDPDYRAINLVFPLYDKLWRLVAATVICAQRYPVSRNPLLDFCENPTRRQFAISMGGSGDPSAADVVNEVLRLYPPIEQISRPYGLPRWQAMLKCHVQTADIKAVQEYDEGGSRMPEPREFMPERWQNEIKPAMFAFGEGKLRCPAHGWVPAAAALIAAKVMDGIDGVRLRMERPSGGGDTRYNWEGWTVRRVR